ncbi:hypothetical protein PFISCL1PPCAC_27707, partial [Pristionchus fissidentatus]
QVMNSCKKDTDNNGKDMQIKGANKASTQPITAIPSMESTQKDGSFWRGTRRNKRRSKRAREISASQTPR